MIRNGCARTQTGRGRGAPRFARPWLAWCLALGAGLAGARGDAGAPSLEEITAGLNRQHEKVESLRVEFTTKAQALGAPEALRKYLRIMGLVDEKNVFAFKGPKRYIRRVNAPYLEDVAPGVEEDWDVIYMPGGEGAARAFKKTLDEQAARIAKSLRGPRRIVRKTPTNRIPIDAESIFGFDGTKARRKSPRQGMAGILLPLEIASDDEYFIQTYMKCIGWILPDPFNPANDRKNERYPDAFARPDTRVLGEPQEVDGHPCAVVTVADRETVWLDPAIGYAVRKFTQKYPGTDVTQWVYSNDDFQEVIPGVWLPRRCHHDVCGPPKSPEAYRGKPLLRYVHAVKKFDVNDVPDTLFTLSLDPGTRVYDRTVTSDGKGGTKGVVFIMPADPSQIDRAIAAAVSASEETEMKAGRSMALLWVNLAVVVMAALACVAFRVAKLMRGGSPA